MRRGDRLRTVLRVRELAERRRLAERAVAQRAALHADAARDRAAEALAASTVSEGVGDAAGLRLARTGGVALAEAVADAEASRERARRGLLAAERRTSEAAVERRSAERLGQRRDRIEAAEAHRRDLRHADEIALQTWRRRR